MDALTQAAAARLAAAVKDCPVGMNAFPEVDAIDVLTVAGEVATPHTGVVASLVQGASGAVKHRHGKCHQNADHLRHLLEQAGC